MILKHGLAALAGFALSFANPAQANETATSVQITGAVQPGKAAAATGDREFGELFASWKSMDATGVVSATPGSAARVALPSGMPVGGVMLTSDYGMRNHPILGRRRNHKGVDLAGPIGTPVYATADGFVSRADRFGSYGNYIQIEHGGELQTRFAHLSGFAVHSGDMVKKGQLIGYIGTTGRSTGPHLHYEVRVAGEAVDPTPYMLAGASIPAGEGAMGGPE